MMWKNTDHSEFYIEKKSVDVLCLKRSVKQSKEHKAIRRIAEFMKKHWKDKVTNLHRIYRVVPIYLLKQK